VHLAREAQDLLARTPKGDDERRAQIRAWLKDK
jgi:hypothetical protein